MSISISKLKYVLITPAHNEENTIEQTIQSVLSQTYLPLKWIIVSDGSTDLTDNIILEYSKKHTWISYLRTDEHKDRHFAAKVHAFNAAYHTLKNIEFDIIGNLDADATFDNDYFEFLISRFMEDLRLGVAGTSFIEDGQELYNYNYTNIEHVTGIIQLFRRECFNEIGGYIPVKAGGIDWIAVTTARMMGWKTRTFLEKKYVHHRKMGTAGSGVLRSSFHYGMKDYFLGGHPLWQIFRSVYQMRRKPYFIAGFLLFSGYIWAGIRRMKRPVSPELLKFHRHEQMLRLKRLYLDLISEKRE